jgi:RNA polymerase sigma-70 factor (ECF subfamily)
MSLVSTNRARWLAAHVLPHEAALRSWLSRRVLSSIDIDDVIQETYATLAAIPRTDHILNPKAYLFEVAKSVVCKEVRRARVVKLADYVELDEISLPSDDPSPEAVIVAREELRRTEAVIDTLPAKCREAFTLRKLRGLSQRETAHRMAISEKTVEKHIGKALFKLMQAVGRANGADRWNVEESDVQTDFKPQRLIGS